VTLEPIKTKGKIKPFEVYDIETTTDLKRVYLVGWYDGRQYKYWESEPLPPEDDKGAMAQFLRWRFQRPTKRPQYGHNAGNFDAVFALAAIIAKFPQLSVTIVPSQSSILLMTVEDKEKRKKWEFRDSARTLPDSLDNLAQCFLGERKIEVEDYATLHRDPRRYDYLRKDCTLLYDILSKYFHLLYDRLGGQAGISAASTALATYRTSYQSRSLPEISEHATVLARGAYYGGRCEPFRREFRGQQSTSRRANSSDKNLPVLSQAEHRRKLPQQSYVKILHCFDVNSMYPWAMRLPQPIEELEINGFHPELSGFVDCTVSVRKCHMPILPCRAEGKLLFPTGTWRGTFSTAELRLAEKYVQIDSLIYHDAVYFRTADIFSDYVDTLYKFRKKTEPDWELSLDRMAKIALNSLYGKFGSNEVRETIHIRPTFNDMVDRQMQQMPSPLGVDCYIERTTKHASYMLPQISAWITALGRCKLAEGLLARGDSAYYCDTDSIYTDGNLETGSALGEWKDEYKEDPIVYAYFLSPKIYVLRHASGKTTNKAKGFARFGQKLPEDAVAILASGESVEVSRFCKARSVIRGEFGLAMSQKRCHFDYEKRIFHEDGTSEPREVHL
jgi:hypothetical protein